MKTIISFLVLAAFNVVAQQQQFSDPTKRSFVLPIKPLQQKTQQTGSSSGLKDSMHLYLLEFVSNTWTMDRTIYSYDANNNENHFITYRQTPTHWQPTFQSMNYVYDSNYNLLSSTRQYWDVSGSLWLNIGKSDATYNSAGDKISSTYQTWNGISWVNNNRGLYTFDNHHNCLTVQSQTFNVGSSQWENESYYTYGYDANNNMILDITQQWDAATSSWVNQTKNSGTFNSNNEYITYISESWNTTNQQWENSARLVNATYVNNDLTYYEIERWNTGTLQYVLSFRVTMSYDGNHNVLNFTSQTYNTTSGLWENTDQDDYTYDSNNNQTVRLFYIGDQNTSGWKNFQRQYDYYNSSVGIKELRTEENRIQVYPNPVKNILTIDSKDKLMFNEISLIDVNGKTVQVQSLNNETVAGIDVSALPAGIYMVQIKAEKKVIYKKVIKE